MHMVERVPVGRPADTVASTLGRLAGHIFDAAEAVYVLDEEDRLLGLARLPDLLQSPGDRTLGEIMVRVPAAVGPGEDQERVAGVAVRHGLSAVPVTSDSGRLLGVVPAPALMAVLRQEHIEDLHRLTGIRHERMQALEAMKEPPVRRARHRLPWLLVGLVGSMLAAFVVSRFARMLEARIAIAFFVPGIVYLADAIGTQTEAIVVRGLSLSDVRLRHLLSGELRTGLLIGLALGVLIFLAIQITFGDARLAGAVALAILVAGGVAATIGLLLPWTLARAGKDPAFGSGPVATVIQDVLSLLIYFLVLRVLGV